MIELKFTGTAESVREQMVALLGGKIITLADLGPGLTGAAVDKVITDGPIGSGGSAVEQVPPADKPTRGRRPRSAPQTIEGDVTSKTVEQPNISAQPENRTDPETAAQDKADEAVDDPRADTLEGVRAAAGKYIKKWGMEHASVDLVPCLIKAAGVGTMSELMKLNDPTKFKAATDAIEAAAASDTRYPTEG